MNRLRNEQDKINAEIDLRLLQFQSIKEICMSIKTGEQNVYRRAILLGLYTQRITDAERDHLLLRRLASK